MAALINAAVTLKRTDYGEADRIVTFLTMNHGRVSLMARGVRRQQSHLAGAVEPLSLLEISFLPPKRELGHLTGARLSRHYSLIMADTERMAAAFRLLKRIYRATESGTGSEYFNLLVLALEGLNDSSLASGLTMLWFNMRLLIASGHGPRFPASGNSSWQTYTFDTETMTFAPARQGIGPNVVKLLKLAATQPLPNRLGVISDATNYLDDSLQLSTIMMDRYLPL